jgi:hypothetical protein
MPLTKRSYTSFDKSSASVKPTDPTKTAPRTKPSKPSVVDTTASRNQNLADAKTANVVSPTGNDLDQAS